MEYTILLLTQNLDKLERAYTVFVQNGSVKKNSSVAITNVKLREELKKAIEILQASTDKSKLLLADVSGSTIYREHCPFKLKPCNYTGRGWYDRCAWCKDNNGFIRPKEDSSKPF